MVNIDLDLRDTNWHHPVFRNALEAYGTARRWYYNTPYTHKKNLRGDMPPLKNLAWKRYQARKRALARRSSSKARYVAKTSSRTFVPRPYSIKRRSYSRKRSAQSTFGTKGITVHQKNSYLLDHSNTRNGFSNATTYFTDYYCSAFDSGVDAPWPVPLGTPGTTPATYVYGRLSSPISKHISSGNMATQFTKVKVNRITHTFNFPDQAAATTNDKWPLVIWVNHADKWRINIDGYGDATEWATADQLLERPGWKKYVVKRMNKLSISYEPTMLKTIESNVIATNVDAAKLVKFPWLDLDASTTQSMRLHGPTICFQLPADFTPAAGSSNQYYENAFKSTASIAPNMSTFLEFTTVTVTAKVSFKDPDNEATKGC